MSSEAENKNGGADVDGDEQFGPTEIESMCPRCEENGTTRILVTLIPFYKSVILMSFACDNCNYRNNELQSGGKVQEQGLRITLRVMNTKDLNRQIVKSEYASITVPELELEIPSRSQPGEITTVEGVLTRVRDGLMQEQQQRREEDPTRAVAIDEFCARINSIMRVEQPFLFQLDDISGNSFIESTATSTPAHYQQDGQLISVQYNRTLEQDKLLALRADDDDSEQTATADENSTAAVKDEVLHFSTPCPNCAAPNADTCMKVVDIPHFKEVVLMNTLCEVCGIKSIECKTATGVAANGCRLTLSVEEKDDLSRDLLKSDTCSVRIPELDVEAGMATLSGRFTTVEGLLNAVREQLRDDCALWLGDSAPVDQRDCISGLLTRLAGVTEHDRPAERVTLVLDDPAGNSYIQQIPNESGVDSRLRVDLYTRTDEQNDDLGLKHMKTENYSTD